MQHKVIVTARKAGALGVQSVGWRYTVEATDYGDACRTALARAIARHSGAHEHFALAGMHPNVLLEIGGRLHITRCEPPASTITDEP